jgi:hypothetical protein
MTQPLDLTIHELDSSSIRLGVLQAGSVETPGTTAFSPRPAVRSVAIFSRAIDWKTSTSHISNSPELIAVLQVAEDPKRPQNSPLR